MYYSDKDTSRPLSSNINTELQDILSIFTYLLFYIPNKPTLKGIYGSHLVVGSLVDLCQSCEENYFQFLT